MAVDEVCINLFYLPKKRLALETVILYGKQMAFVNLTLFDNGTALSDYATGGENLERRNHFHRQTSR